MDLHIQRHPARKYRSEGMTDQWAGAGMPLVFCILRGSANMPAATPGGGRQPCSEPPMQLWGAAAHAQTRA